MVGDAARLRRELVPRLAPHRRVRARPPQRQPLGAALRRPRRTPGSTSGRSASPRGWRCPGWSGRRTSAARVSREAAAATGPAGGHAGRRRQHRLVVRGGRLGAARPRRGPARLRHEHVPHRGRQPGAPGPAALEHRRLHSGLAQRRRRGRLGAGRSRLVAARPRPESVPYETLYEEAAAAGPGAGGLLALPYFAGERTPLFDPDLRGVIVGPDRRRTAAGTSSVRSWRPPRSRCARTSRRCARPARTIARPAQQRRRRRRGALWPQIVSDVTGLAQDVREGPSGRASGAALLAAVGRRRGDAARPTWPQPAVRVEPDPGDRRRLRRAATGGSASSRSPRGLTPMRSRPGSESRSRGTMAPAADR